MEAPSVGRRSRGRRNGGRDASAGVGAERPPAGPGRGGGWLAGDGERAGRRAGAGAAGSGGTGRETLPVVPAAATMN